jgi:hypothetical protein
MATDAGKVIYGILSVTSGVTSLVSTRIYPTIAPAETVAPFITFRIVSNNPTDTKTRPSKVDFVRVQIDCWGRTYASAEAVHGAVRTAIDNYALGSTVASVKVDGIKFETENDALDEEIDIYRRSADYILRIKY